jgi:hypothetical protein
MTADLSDEIQQGIADHQFIPLFVGSEPGAVVVALELAKELEEGRFEKGGIHRRPFTAKGLVG